MMKKSVPAIFSMLSLVNLQDDGEEKGRVHCTKKMKFFITDFFSKCDQTTVFCGLGHFY